MGTQPGQLTKRFLDESEVEDAYGFNKRTLQKMRLVGRGPRARKFGRAVRYDVIDIEAWIQSLPVVGSPVQVEL